MANVCAHIKAQCSLCKKVGHLRRVCRTKASTSTDKEDNHNSNHNSKKKENINTVEEICNIKDNDNSKIYIALNCEEDHLRFEIDSGSPVTIIGYNVYKEKFPNVFLSETSKRLISYCGTELKMYGVIHVNVNMSDKVINSPIYVVDTGKNPLLGREWMKALSIDWNKYFSGNLSATVAQIDIKCELNNVTKKFASVFDDKIGKIRDLQAKLVLKPDAKPVFIRERNVPFARKSIIEGE
jgi:hypothetical protein